MHRHADRVTIEKLKRAELDLILGPGWRSGSKRRAPKAATTEAATDPDRPVQNQPSSVPEPTPALWGISLSGGGIRSATFSLGVLQVLARNNLLRCFHYQSTISGGGYIGAFLQGLIRRKGYRWAFDVLKSGVDRRSGEAVDQTHSPDDPQQPILHLRRYSNYLSPRKSALTGDTLGMLGTYVRNVLLIQLQLCALLLLLSLVPVAVYPWIKRIALQWPAWLLLAAGIMCVLSVILLGQVTSSANRLRSVASKRFSSGTSTSTTSPRHSATVVRDGVEVIGSGLLWCAAISVVALASATVLAAAGLWGLNTRAGSVADGWFTTSHGSAFWSSLDSRLFWIAGGGYFLAWMIWLRSEAFAAQLRGWNATGSHFATAWNWLRNQELIAKSRVWRATASRLAACMSWLRSKFSMTKPDPTSEDTEEEVSPLMMHTLRFVLASLVAAAFAGWALVQMRHINTSWLGDTGLWHAMIFGPTCVLVVLTLTGILHVGLAGPALSDLQREVWARVGGKAAALVVIGMTLSFAFTIYGPWLLMQGLSLAHGNWGVTGWAGVLSWAVTSGAGVIAAYSARLGDSKRRSRLLDALVHVAPWVFLFGLLVAISRLGLMLLAASGWDALPLGSSSTSVYLDYLSRQSLLHEPIVLGMIASALVVWLLFGFAVDLNEFSMNAFYRNRLVRCYLGATNPARAAEPITNFDPRDDLVLADVVEVERDNGMRPLFPLIGTSLNLVGASQLDWQDRKAASFCLTPGHCGYIPPPSHPADDPVGDLHAATAGTAGSPRTAANKKAPAANDSIAATLTLGSAVTISGAAVSPNMGSHSSPAVTFLLTLFDARLGWWLLNPSRKHTYPGKRITLFDTRVGRWLLKPKRKHAPPGNGINFFGRWLVTEMLGRTRSTGKYVYLSDGGHFENLGIYELVRRGCRFIVCVDAGADPNRDFADLGNATEKCRIDFGVDIQIVTSDLQPDAENLSKRSCAVGRIIYPDGSPPGTLLYLKPSLTGAEPNDVAHYARAQPRFPHQPTSDQYFDEAQFESYRRLGETVASSAIEPVLDRVDASPEKVDRDKLKLGDSRLKELFLIELERYWVAPLSGVQQHFARHAASMSTLFSKLRDDPRLAVLDAQIYPAWLDLICAAPVSGDGERKQTRYQRKTELPSDENFRACFYFCQELTQLMQAIYQDFDLEREWEHPDNVGWMNAFRQWSRAAIFRVAWAVGAPTYGKPFVTFCELRLGLPDLAHAVHVQPVPHDEGVSWAEQCRIMEEGGRINNIERGFLLCQPVLDHGPTESLRLFLLHIQWKSVLYRADPPLPDTTLGIAVLQVKKDQPTRDATLIMMRVQDHLRHMGLGSEFARLLVARQQITSVHVRPGWYDAANIFTHRSAAALQAQIAGMLGRAVSVAKSQGNAQQAAHKQKTPTAARPSH